MLNTKELQAVRRHLSALGKKVTQDCRYHLYSIWLFTFSDLKTILLPSTAFGILNGIAVSLDAGPAASGPSPSRQIPMPSDILGRTPLVLLWVWVNLLPFDIDNQRQAEAIEEDRLNKPWRPMPSRRLSPRWARRVMMGFYAAAAIVSVVLGAPLQCFALMLLGYWYNDLGGADSNCFVRNLINGCGFICFSSGAMQVAIGRYESVLKLLGWWFLVIACIVLTTVQTQDMYDQQGDAARNRKTLPLVIGDGPARWTIAVFMVGWCWVVPWLWVSSVAGYVAPVLLGSTVAVRTLMKRSEREDKVTFRLWNLWLVSLYLLPLMSR